MSTFLLKKNNAKTTLSTSINGGDLSLVVADGSVFPATGDFYITIWNKTLYPDPGDDANMEIVKCTARSSNTLTIDRAEDSTSAHSHNSGDAVEMLFTAGHLNEIETVINGLETLLGVDVGDIQDQIDAINAEIDGLVPYTGATSSVNLATYGLTGASITASAASAGPKFFVYNSSVGGSSLSLGAGGSISYLLFPSSKTFFIGPVSDITAAASSGDGKLIVDSQSVYVGAYATLNSEALIVWGNLAIGDNGTNSAKSLRFYEPSGSGSNYSEFKAQAQSGNLTYILPATSSTGYMKNTSGTLSWTDVISGSTGAFSGAVTVLDDPYSASWNGSSEVPTKNAVYDKIKTIVDLVSYTYYGGL